MSAGPELVCGGCGAAEADPKMATRTQDQMLRELLDSAEAIKSICLDVLPDYLIQANLDRIVIAGSLAHAAGVLSERVFALLEDLGAAISADR